MEPEDEIDVEEATCKVFEILMLSFQQKITEMDFKTSGAHPRYHWRIYLYSVFISSVTVATEQAYKITQILIDIQ